MFLCVTSMDSVSLMSLEIGWQILHIRSGPSSNVPSSLKVLSAAIGCSSWDWHSPGTPESSLPLWLLWWGCCLKQRSVFLSWVWVSNGKRNSQGICKSFKFHYNKYSFLWNAVWSWISMKHFPEGEWESLSALPLPCQNCSLFTAAYDNSLFFTN